LDMSFEGWDFCKIGDVAVVKGGKRLPKGAAYSLTKTNHPYIRLVDIEDGKISNQSIQYLPREIQSSIKRYIVETDDVCLAIVGHTIGVVFYVDGKWHGANLTENAARLTSFKNVDSKFLYYYLISHEGQSEIKRNMVGSAQGKLPIYGIQNISIPIPPIKIQKRIASILSSLDDKIELNRQTNQTLEAIAQAIFKEWFVDFNFPGATGEMQDSELGEIPKGWKVGSIGDLFAIFKNSINPSLVPDEQFIHYSLPAFDESKRPTSELGKQILSNKFVVKNDCILVSKLNPRIPRIWPIIEVEKNSICSTEFQVLIPKDTHNFSYGAVVFWQSSIIETMKGRATGTSSSHQRIRPQDMLDIQIVVPSKGILKEFDLKIKSLFVQIKNNEEQTKTLTQLRDSLLPKLMKGEINLNHPYVRI
jgi:type I restriction enzyme, S subunit